MHPGGVSLPENLTGKGQLTRGHGAGDRPMCVVALDDDVKIV